VLSQHLELWYAQRQILVGFQAEISSLGVGGHPFLMPFIVAVTPSMVMYFSTISFLFYKALWLQALMCHHLGRSWRRSGDQVSLFFHIR
jgi:hypothetical protein